MKRSRRSYETIYELPETPEPWEPTYPDCEYEWCNGDVPSYMKHYRRGITACRACKDAWQKYYEEYHENT